jgi:hypothetical protein
LSALTKTFIVLQLLFSVVCAVLLVLFVTKTENYKNLVTDERVKNVGLAASYANAERSKSATESEVNRLQGQLSDTMKQLTTARDTAAAAAATKDAALQEVKNQLSAALAQNQTLAAANTTNAATIDAKDKELAGLRTQVPDLVAKYNTVSRAKIEVDNQLRAAELAIRKLQETIAQMPGGGAGAAAPIGSENQIQVLTASNAAAAGKINGQVSNVALAQGRTLIEMPLGERDGIKVGAKLYVYRASGYIGDATVERVSADQSVAVIMSTKPGETVKVGDLVATVGQ